MRFILVVLGFYLMFVQPVKADNSMFAKFYEIDLENDPLPSMETLESMLEKHSDYNRKFDTHFDLLWGFDSEFAATIASYGHQEKRIKPVDEDLMIDAIKQFAPIYYQYIGPQLFEVPGMSEKILNMPGIKETKNKFPTRIADEVKDIEDIEFLSPSLYFILMPESWPGYEGNFEEPKAPFYHPKIKYNPQFYAFIKKIVPMNEYMPGYKAPSGKGKDDMRTIFPNANTVLTSADVKAVIVSLDKVEDWLKKPENEYQVYRIGTLLTMYEQEDDVGKYAHTVLRNMVNPCARLVQKVRILGRDNELAALVAPQGFSLNEWAYSCDKVVHAYRLSHITYGVMQSLRLYQRGIYDNLYARFSPQFRNSQMAVMQAIIKAYQAPIKDVLAVKKNRVELDEKIKNREFEVLGHPIFFD